MGMENGVVESSLYFSLPIPNYLLGTDIWLQVLILRYKTWISSTVYYYKLYTVHLTKIMNEPTSNVRSFNGVHHELCHSNEAITYERLMSTSSLEPLVL